MRTAALGLIGLVFAVAVGLGVHLITRDTISLPIVQLEPPTPLAPPAATAGRTTTTAQATTTEPERETETETEDNSGSGSSGSGRGRGRGGSRDDDD